MSTRRRPARVTALLVTTREGAVLLTQGGPRPGDLPHTRIRTRENPYSAARRLAAGLNLSLAETTLLAIDEAEGYNGPQTVHVMSARLSPSSAPPAAGHCLTPVGQATAAMTPSAASRLKAVCRATILNTMSPTRQEPLRLVDGRNVLQPATKAERTRSRFTWHPRLTPPEEIPVQQTWGWLVDPHGRVLVMLDRHGVPSLPGGRPEAGESPFETLAREAEEEVQARLSTPYPLGYQQVREHGRPPYAQLRLGALLRGLDSAAPDRDTGEKYQRVLIPARQANLLLGWGPEGDAQAHAVSRIWPPLTTRPAQYVPETGLEFTEE
ncbi:MULTISPECIES: NUDIX hydrolase [unclassified Streptomyces]|uniref:NUDIX hydrolase n=1 Tax=unclassified Streptomyces TaxID=2593676 RepID=UPI002E2E2E02|nr:NUDIX hydrolase [Streptomyces sp. NBC_00273]